jgi:hypothetical protein
MPPDRNLDYPSAYREKPVAMAGTNRWQFALMMVAGSAGWVMVGLLIRWIVKS